MPCCYGSMGGRECAVTGLPITDISPERPHFHCYVLEKTPTIPPSPKLYSGREKYFLLPHKPNAVGLITANSGVTGHAGLYDMADPICWQRFTCTPRVSWGQSVFVSL